MYDVRGRAVSVRGHSTEMMSEHALDCAFIEVDSVFAHAVVVAASLACVTVCDIFVTFARVADL